MRPIIIPKKIINIQEHLNDANVNTIVDNDNQALVNIDSIDIGDRWFGGGWSGCDCDEAGDVIPSLTSLGFDFDLTQLGDVDIAVHVNHG